MGAIFKIYKNHNYSRKKISTCMYKKFVNLNIFWFSFSIPLCIHFLEGKRHIKSYKNIQLNPIQIKKTKILLIASHSAFDKVPICFLPPAKYSLAC